MYRERRDTMLDSLEEHMPQGIKWTHPKGGLFLWVTLPTNMDAKVIFNDALKKKVAFVPGTNFFAEGGGNNTMRLNFSNAKPEMINEGISRLSEVIKNHLIKE